MTLLELAIAAPNAVAHLAWIEEAPSVTDLGPLGADASLHLYAGRSRLANDDHSGPSIVDPEGFWDWPLAGPWIDTVLTFGNRNHKLPELDPADLRTLATRVQGVARDCMRDSDVVVAHGLAAVVPWLVAARPYIALIDGRAGPIDDPVTLRATLESVAALCRDSTTVQRLGEFGIEARELPAAREPRRALVASAASMRRHAVAGFDSLRQKRLELQYEAASADGYDAKYHAALAYRQMDHRIAMAIAGAVKGEGRAIDLLDVGCGPGSLVPALREIGSVNIVGIDLSPEMIEIARERYPTARFEVGDVEALAFPDASFDAVLCSGMLHHLAALDGAMAQIARVLRPGGIMLAREPNEDNFGSRYPEVAFAHLCLMHGLYYATNRDVVYEPESHDYHRDFELAELAAEVGQTLRVERVWTDLRVSYFYEMMTDDAHAPLLNDFENSLGDVPGLNAMVMARKPAAADGAIGLTPEVEGMLATFGERKPLPPHHFTTLLDQGQRLLAGMRLPQIPSDREFGAQGLRSLLPWLSRAQKILVVCDPAPRARPTLPLEIAKRAATMPTSEFLTLREDARVDFLVLALDGAPTADVLAHAFRVCRPHGVLYASVARAPFEQALTDNVDALFAGMPYAAAAIKRTHMSVVVFPYLFTALDFFKAVKVAAETENGRMPDSVDAALTARIGAAVAKAAVDPGYSRLHALENGRTVKALLAQAGCLADGRPDAPRSWRR